MDIRIDTATSASYLALSQVVIARSVRSALTRTLRSMSVHAERELREDLRVSLKIARSRLRAFRNSRSDTEQATLSGSLHSIPAIILGKPTRTAKGIKVGAREFRGGFLARSQFKDKLEKRIYHRRKRNRFPIEQDRVLIDKQVTRAIDVAAGFVFDLFKKNLENELKYRMRKLT